MGSYGGYYRGDKKKPKRQQLERQALKVKRMQTLPQVEIISRKGK